MTERKSLQITPAASAMNTIVAPPSSFEDLWAKALADYKEQTGREIDQAQMAQFPDRPSVDDVVRILETQTKDLKTFRKRGEKIRAVLKPVVRIVQVLNDTAAEAANAASVPGGKAVFVAFGLLLTAAKGVTEVYDALEELKEIT
ncbi:hypothetical protein GYMLUDRAFT_493533 [Collybiopsis luxurians FD-317 M1]|uniref:Fungal STAND N-terminal Goodbye domain-containing protein n=1 Tax=Collybiopsis luxurians FD-317 M1 TaxID=944289 RepID=A0A0D0BXA2_9AGAR|nr:hypothetical protein GYMLUDRAFT_493533 [Collybiopsis luxurians FD-317 M1]